jgi:hypothetical protein
MVDGGGGDAVNGDGILLWSTISTDRPYMYI